jgi:hypothetical protein
MVVNDCEALNAGTHGRIRKYSHFQCWLISRILSRPYHHRSKPYQPEG